MNPQIASENIEKPYYLEPDKKAEKAYVLLREAMKRAKKVGIATFVMHEREHVAMIKAEGRVLVLVTLRYQDEIRPPDDLDLPMEKKYTAQELDMALQLISHLQKHFRAKEFKDTYTTRLKKIISQKSKGQPVRITQEADPVPTDMRKLMAILKESLEKEKVASSSRRL